MVVWPYVTVLEAAPSSVSLHIILLSARDGTRTLGLHLIRLPPSPLTESPRAAKAHRPTDRENLGGGVEMAQGVATSVAGGISFPFSSPALLRRARQALWAWKDWLP